MIYVMGSFCCLFEEKNGALFVLFIKQLNSINDFEVEVIHFTSLFIVIKSVALFTIIFVFCEVGGYCR